VRDFLVTIISEEVEGHASSIVVLIVLLLLLLLLLLGGGGGSSGGSSGGGGSGGGSCCWVKLSRDNVSVKIIYNRNKEGSSSRPTLGRRGQKKSSLFLSKSHRFFCLYRTSNAQEQVINVASLEGTLEEGGPVGLNLNLSGRQDGSELVSSDGDSVVVEDQSGVGAGEFRDSYIIQSNSAQENGSDSIQAHGNRKTIQTFNSSSPR
jgi:hypothetical protein